MKKCFIMVLSLTVIFLVACKGKKLIDKQELASQEWILSEFKNGDTLQKLPAEKLTIFFTDTNTVYGMAGCGIALWGVMNCLKKKVLRCGSRRYDYDGLSGS